MSSTNTAAEAILNSCRALYSLGADHALYQSPSPAQLAEIAELHYQHISHLLGDERAGAELYRRWEPIAASAPDDGRTWGSVDEINAANIAAGHHWFQPATIEYFESRTYGTVHHGRYFISSELPPYGDRQYKVRYADHLGRITTSDAGPFDNYTKARIWLNEQVNCGAVQSWGPESTEQQDVPRETSGASR